MASFNQGLFEEMLKKKYDLMQMREDTDRADQLAKAPLYEAQAGYYGGKNETDLAGTAMQYGPGGAVDRSALASERIAGLQYGPGGSADRGFAAEDRRTAAVSPYYAGAGAQHQAEADKIRQGLPLSLALDKKMMEGLASPIVAKPKVMGERRFITPFEQMDEDNARWQPFGSDAPFTNWMSRRARNISEFPRRMLNELANPVRSWSGWNR
jgi:hypothetical protein